MTIIILVVALVSVLAGCVTTQMPRPTLITKNMRSWTSDEPTLSRDVLIAANGSAVATTTTQSVSKWQIHPDAPLDKVVPLTCTFQRMELMEIWTSSGIFLLNAPAYGYRRLPWMAKDVDYRVTMQGEIQRDDKPWSRAHNAADAANKIFADLSKKKHVGFVNLYFEFNSDKKWADAEAIINEFLPRIDSLRGLWIGLLDSSSLTLNGKGENSIFLHLHDIEIETWDRSADPNTNIPGAADAKLELE